MCRHDCRVRSSNKDQYVLTAEESLASYCKPVELYNILQRRAVKRPHFLQRCLRYKIEAKHSKRMRIDNVAFNYKYYNNTLQKTEVTEDFSCAFCLVKCASFQGLRFHLCASHDLFNFEFWVTEDYQAVNVSLKNDLMRSEVVTDETDLKCEAFFLCSKPLKRATPENPSQNAKHVHLCDQNLISSEVMRNGFINGHLEKATGTSSFPMSITAAPTNTKHSNQFLPQMYDNDTQSIKERDDVRKPFFDENDLWDASNTAESNIPASASVADCLERVASSLNVKDVSTAMAQSSADPEGLPGVTEGNLGHSAMLQFAKTRKLSVERSDPRHRILLQKRQFYHSHTAQPMELEQVLSDRDSEDEVDDDIADIEDQRMLEDFVDVTKNEQKIMHLWNLFVRTQRVLADGHIPWACEAFSRLHEQELAQDPALFWCWRLFLIKLWNQSLLDTDTMNNCNKVVIGYDTVGSDPMQS